MNKLKVFFLVCVIAGIASCNCLDCTYPAKKHPAYTNKSGEMVKITATGNYTSKIFEKIIADGDTLHYNPENIKEWDIPEINDCGFAYNCDYPLEIRMELHFLDDLVKCLIFDGPIKNDGIDTRSIKSYKKGEEIYRDENWFGVEYIYTITPELRALAKEEDCQD